MLAALPTRLQIRAGGRNDVLVIHKSKHWLA